MSGLHPRRLCSTAVTTALAAALLAAFSPTAATSASAPAAPAAAAAPTAPESAGSATGFAFFILLTRQPLCSGSATNETADPYIERSSCAFVNFSATGATGAMTGELYAEGATTPFATRPVNPVTGSPGVFRVSLQPNTTTGNNWTSAPGKVRLVIKDTVGEIGETSFFYNALRATALNTGAATAPADAFTVSGTIAEHTGGTLGGDTDVPAKYKIRVTKADGTPLYTSPELTADSGGTDGAISHTIPAGTASGINPDASTNYQALLSVAVVDASYTDSSTGVWKATTAGTAPHTIAVTPTSLTIENSFVSSVGWVKPGEAYPSRIIVTNPTAAPVTPTVQLRAPTGSTFESASGPGSDDVSPGDTSATWSPGPIPAGTKATLVLQSKAATLTDLTTVVWRDLSSTAVLQVSGQSDLTDLSHGPKVIPPNETYETARYGDRPFPIVPVQYTDRTYQATHSGDSLESVINDPANEGSTFNLFQEMSLEQLFPDGTVPSAGITSKDFTYAPGFDFSRRAVPGNTCKGTTLAGTEPAPTAPPYGNPALYPERITNGVYNLPGQTEYYGSDSNGSAVAGSVAGVGALQNIDSGCGDTGKLVYDAAALADPEIDYSDFDTDKDGVVDFFMVVYAGCGGNGGSQLGPLGCDYPGAPYDNIWPHSSSLENGYRDPVTGLTGFTTDDQLKSLKGEPLWYTTPARTDMTPTPGPDNLKVFVRVGPYNVNPETAIDFASVISHEYGHSLGLPDFYSTGSRETYGDWNLMATDKSHNMDAYSRQEMGWVVPRVLDSTRTVDGFKDSKEDIGSITWQEPDGTPYTLTQGADGTVHNSEMYVAKLPGRTLLDPAAFDTGDKASKSHLWWSGSGNDFGCPPTTGRNFDLSIPLLSDLTNPNATAKLSFKSRWDIEWDYDYGYVLTTTDGGTTYRSHPSTKGYTSSNTDPAAANPNNVSCQALYDNGITGSSGSYQAGTEAVDRKAGNVPPAVFLTDEYDISDLAGEANGALRFTYSTDPGLARPGWFIDDVKITVDPDGAAGGAAPYDVLATDFETSGGPEDPRVFNGGCQEDLSTAKLCTLGWKYLKAGAESAQDHAYYLEMRDRSGFDLDGNGEADRGAPEFEPGLYLSYTDESHGYGNVGTDNPPAQSPLDSVPQVGSDTPNLNDAAFKAAVAARSTFSDSSAAPHIDNYTDPDSPSGNWEFGYDCLGFKVDSMAGDTPGPQQANGDLTGNVTFTMGAKCGAFNYGYVDDEAPPGNTPPVAKATASPSTVKAGKPVSLSAAGSTDAETPNALDYSWDFGDGGTKKDAGTRDAKATYTAAGTYTAKVTVTDPEGASDTESVTIKVTDGTAPVARISVSPKRPFTSDRIRLSGAGSSDDTTSSGKLKYQWSFGDGGKAVDATGRTVRTKFRQPGPRVVSLRVTDEAGNSTTTSKKVRVLRYVTCNSARVNRGGSWQIRRDRDARRGVYCDSLGNRRGRDVLTMRFSGPSLMIVSGDARNGGQSSVFIDGRRRTGIGFKGSSRDVDFNHRRVYGGLGPGRHTMRLVLDKQVGYIEGFVVKR